MPQLLPQARIEQILQAFQALPLVYGPAERAVFLASVSKVFVNFLPTNLPPGLQLRSDVNNLNSQGPLVDGSIPFLQWLSSVAAQAAGLDEQRVFLSAADDISHSVTGAPRLNPPGLPEYKEKIVHEDDMLLPTFLVRGVDAGQAVAKLRVPRVENGAVVLKQGKPLIYLGTGWLLAPDLLMTNQHVINARNEGEAPAAETDLVQQGAETSVQFDFDDEALTGTIAKVLKMEAWDPPLDYALLRLEPTGRKPLTIRPSPLEQKPGEYLPVNIVQHPGGQSKKYAIRNNLVSAITATDIRYFTDTQGGSSGSPVLDDSWQVVGLHRGSTFAEGVQFQGRSTAWVNLGTPIHAILADLKKRYGHLIF